MSVILVIRPDPLQAKALNDVARRVGTELLVVDSTARAVEAIGRQIPDLILLSAFLSPRDEDTLMDRLRSLDGASHLQTISIPQFHSPESKQHQKKKAGFGFRKKQKAPVPVGADPAAFAEEVAALLQRASEIRNRPAQTSPRKTVIVNEFNAAETVAEEPFVPDHIIEEFFARKAGAIEPLVLEGVVGVPVEEHAVQVTASDEIIEVPDVVSELLLDVPVTETEMPARPIFGEAAARATPALSMADEIHQLVRRLGIDVELADVDDAPALLNAGDEDDTDVFDFGASLDRACNEGNLQRLPDASLAQIDADALREEAIAEARAVAEREAREALAAELQRVQAEAEQMRETAIAEARDIAAREARNTLAVEVARVRSEAEFTFTDALNRVKTEAEEAERRRIDVERVNTERLNAEAQQAFTRELVRVRAEVEESLAVQLSAAREEAERMRVAEAEVVYERAAVEAQLKAELERLRFVTAQTRKADESETRKAAQQIKQLEAELAVVRTKAEARTGDEIEELRAQMVELREAAAQHARTAAAEAVAAEVARATARPPAIIAQFPARALPRTDSRDEAIAQRDSRDYLSLWQPKAPEPVVVETPAAQVPSASLVASNYVRRNTKWALPIAACLLLVTNTGTAIRTVARFVQTEQQPTAVVQPMQAEPPFIEVIENRVGQLKIDSTPSGAEAIVGGKNYGRTPVTIPDLDVGVHTLVLRSPAGSITRRVAIKPNRTTVLTEAIYSGWLAIFSPIPVAVKIDGRPVNLSDDGRLMATPGAHVVEFVSEQFNFHETETLDVRPGETTAHTLTLPSGTVRVRAPEGSEIRVDGQPAPGNSGQAFPVAIGSHEISASHPERGERRASIDVKQGGLTEVTLPYE